MVGRTMLSYTTKISVLLRVTNLSLCSIIRRPMLVCACNRPDKVIDCEYCTDWSFLFFFKFFWSSHFAPPYSGTICIFYSRTAVRIQSTPQFWTPLWRLGVCSGGALLECCNRFSWWWRTFIYWACAIVSSGGFSFVPSQPLKHKKTLKIESSSGKSRGLGTRSTLELQDTRWEYC